MFRSPQPPSDGYAPRDSSHAFDSACRRKTCPGFGYRSNKLSELGQKNFGILRTCVRLPIARQLAAALRDLSGMSPFPQSGQTRLSTWTLTSILLGYRIDSQRSFPQSFPASHFWHRRTNVWRAITSPARGPKRLTNG